MSNEVLKAEKDFTKQVDELLPEAQKLAQACLEDRNTSDEF